MSALSEKILNTVKYFDVQNHPLTLLEISKYLLALPLTTDPGEQKPMLIEIQHCIETDLSRQILQIKGFYVLSGRSKLVERRLYNNFYATPRLKLAKFYLPFTRHIPFIQAVALSGSEAINNSKKGSDIDLLVLTKRKRMFLARVLISGYLQLIGLRRHGSLIENRFCLNHYIEEGKRLKSDQNIYTAIEYVSLIPFFGGAALYNFQTANMDWIEQYLNNPYIADYKTPAPSFFKRFIEFVFNNKLGDFLERITGNIQYKKIKIGEYITVENDELSFHPGSKGQQVLAKAKSVIRGLL